MEQAPILYKKLVDAGIDTKLVIVKNANRFAHTTERCGGARPEPGLAFAFETAPRAIRQTERDSDTIIRSLSRVSLNRLHH